MNHKKNNIDKLDNTIKFYLNSNFIELENVGARDTLLEYLRLDRSLIGTKEGCGEGDCGACTVLIGRLELGELEYKVANSCICLMPSLNASHVVTIENLCLLDGTLHPIQQAMVDYHGSQCGFCTPGIVMALYGAWIKGVESTDSAIKQSLQGNLCRCTGYGPIIKAAKSVSKNVSNTQDKLVQGKEAMKNNLIDLIQKEALIGSQEGALFIVPKSVDELSEVYLKYSEATIVSGGTDVGLWITKHLSMINPVIFIGNLQELRKIAIVNERIELGSCVTYSEFELIFLKYFSAAKEFLSRIAGEQIRNVGTIGGNIGNASPIGDLAPLFIGLRGTMLLRKGKFRREILIENFFIDYAQQDIDKSEFIEKICIPLNENLYCFPYKVSKRRDEDISTVSAVFSFKVVAGKLFNVRIAFGGMAQTPRRARSAENALSGKKFDISVVKLAQLAIENDFRPISDMRASSKYRMQVAKNLIKKCYVEYTAGEKSKSSRDIYKS